MTDAASMRLAGLARASRPPGNGMRTTILIAMAVAVVSIATPISERPQQARPPATTSKATKAHAPAAPATKTAAIHPPTAPAAPANPAPDWGSTVMQGLSRAVMSIAPWLDPLAPKAPTAGSDPIFAAVDVSHLPMGMQNSNPGNIKFVAGLYWPGQLGPSQNTDQGDPQVVFDNASDGMDAAAQLIVKRFHWGHNTIRKLIAAPRVGWTPGYLPGAKGVAEAAGLGLDQKLDLTDPAILAKVLRGLVIQEHGIAGLIYPDELIQAAATKAIAMPPDKAGS